MRSAISVAASTSYRYASLTTIALPENSTLPATASARPIRNRRRADMDTQRFYGRDASHVTRRAPRRPREARPAGMKATPPNGVTAPRRALAGQREHVQTAAEEHDADRRSTPAAIADPAGPARARPGDGQQRERVHQLVAHADLEDREQVGARRDFSACAPNAPAATPIRADSAPRMKKRRSTRSAPSGIGHRRWP